MMKYRALIFQVIVVVALATSCHSHQREAKRIVKEWMGKEIIRPDQDLTYKIQGRDTLCPDIWDKRYKIFVYVDSIGCTSCRLGLPQWKAIIDTCRQDYPEVGFLFVIHSSDYKKLERELRFHELDYPIIYDYHDAFYKLNKFPPDPYRTYLLRKDNKVTLIGSPISNPRIWELYKAAFSEGQ